MSIFICGITGNQGSSIATHLLKHSPPPPVRGLTRNASSPISQNLVSRGITLIEGDYSNTAALETAIAGCTSLFLNLNPCFTDDTLELHTAKTILTIARAAGVKQVLYSSGLSTDSPEKLNSWDPNSLVGKSLLSKKAIEHQVRTFGFDAWTILRPGGFMSNYVLPLVKMYDGLVENGRWNTALQRDSIIPLVDVETIGRFGCAALLDTERFNGKEIGLADEFLTADDVLGKLAAVTGRDLKAVYMTDEEVDAQKGTNPIVAGLMMMRDLAKFVDLEQVREWGFQTSSMDKFIERETTRVVETYKKGD
ncbi:hypothetical protein QQS21_011433 [Conoideocrella luteorostrata]|uniref:NmrA-like domain-containing protein n=1 Tax=Conoideocrella luteorostrata TaxID=1105319 RepID=A0AAJ0FTC5_9HYPO|nr:hypothetical protein QQS21_011433 [Conoideocrella luteorostrata]